MRSRLCRDGLVFFCLIATLAAACGESPASPGDLRNVSGTWDARFVGTVQGQGTSQTDTIVMELQQSGSAVTGTLRYSGAPPLPLTGQVNGSAFTYTARAPIGPNCEAVVRAETMIDSSGARLSGPSTQSTCEGTAAGEVSATRR